MIALNPANHNDYLRTEEEEEEEEDYDDDDDDDDDEEEAEAEEEEEDVSDMTRWSKMMVLYCLGTSREINFVAPT